MRSNAIEAVVNQIARVLRAYGPGSTLDLNDDARIRVSRGTVRYTFTPQSFAAEVGEVLGLKRTIAPSIIDVKNAPSGIGPYANEWVDKPHRLLYDVCNEVARLELELLAAECKIEELESQRPIA